MIIQQYPPSADLDLQAENLEPLTHIEAITRLPLAVSLSETPPQGIGSILPMFISAVDLFRCSCDHNHISQGRNFGSQGEADDWYRNKSLIALLASPGRSQRSSSVDPRLEGPSSFSKLAAHRHLFWTTELFILNAKIKRS